MGGHHPNWMEQGWRKKRAGVVNPESDCCYRVVVTEVMIEDRFCKIYQRLTYLSFIGLQEPQWL